MAINTFYRDHISSTSIDEANYISLYVVTLLMNQTNGCHVVHAYLGPQKDYKMFLNSKGHIDHMLGTSLEQHLEKLKLELSYVIYPEKEKPPHL